AISVKTGSNEFVILPASGLTDKNLYMIKAEKLISNNISPDFQPLVLEIINKINTPNLTFSMELTDKAIEIAMSNVLRTSGYVRKGSIIIQNGEKLTSENIDKISSYQSSVSMNGDSGINLVYYFGGIGHASI